MTMWRRTLLIASLAAVATLVGVFLVGNFLDAWDPWSEELLRGRRLRHEKHQHFWSTDRDGVLREELVRQRQVWAQNAAPDYVLTVRTECSSCSCRGPFRALIRNGQVQSAAALVGDEPIPEQCKMQVLPIDQLFDDLEKIISSNPYGISIVYHAYWGYPAALSVDYKRDVVDDEFTQWIQLEWQ